MLVWCWLQPGHWLRRKHGIVWVAALVMCNDHQKVDLDQRVNNDLALKKRPWTKNPNPHSFTHSPLKYLQDHRFKLLSHLSKNHSTTTLLQIPSLFTIKITYYHFYRDKGRTLEHKGLLCIQKNLISSEAAKPDLEKELRCAFFLGSLTCILCVHKCAFVVDLCVYVFFLLLFGFL